MEKKNSKLDEMQEQELLQVEHNGCRIAFWGLLAAMAVQQIINKDMDFRTIIGEWTVFIILALYLAIACVRRGIWDRYLPMNTKTNLAVSAATGLAFGIFSAAVIFRNYQKPAGTAIAALISSGITFVLCFAAMTIAMKQTAKRKEQLEKEPDDADRI